MGKKQHQSDRMFLTAKEWKELGGKKEHREEGSRRLPFDHCALTFTPWTTPVCDQHGNVFELMHIIPYLQKEGKNPITSEPLHFRDLIRLHFDRDSEGRWRCPVSLKLLGEHTRIVAVKVTGNVYSGEVVDELNVKAHCMDDLITGQPFTKDDIITIQDPHSIKLMQPRRQPEAEQKTASASETARSTAAASVKSSAAAAASSSSSSSSSDAASVGLTPARGLHSDHRYSGSFTSTAMSPVTSNVRIALTEAEKRAQWYRHLRRGKKELPAYVRIRSSKGDINLMLHCHLAPATCHNFLTLAASGYYNGTRCHRLVPGFMSQWGDPTATGKGGKGAFADAFADEIHPRLKHDKKGVLSMANAGKDTNGSQFFLTFAPCLHLDGLHSIFGQVVGGFDALDAVEAVPVRSGSEQPAEPVTIDAVDIYENPFSAGWVARDELTGRREDEEQREQEDKKKRAVDGERAAWFSRPAGGAAQGGQQQQQQQSQSQSPPPVGHLIAAPQGSGDAGRGTKRKDVALPAPALTDDEVAVSQLKKRQAVAKALQMSSNAAGSRFDFSSW